MMPDGVISNRRVANVPMTPCFLSSIRASGERVLDSVRGCTFDDFILAPQRSVLARRDPAVIDLSCRLSRRITLKRPIVSANMDTVTRAPMAIVQAEEGGIGIIDRGFRPGEIEPQVREVEIVKRTQHGVISDPYSIRGRRRFGEALSLDGALARRHAGRRRRRSPPARAADRARHAVRQPIATRRVAERMTPLDRLVVHRGPLELAEAERDHGRAQGQEAAARRRRRPAARADHGARSHAPAAAAVCHARRAGPAACRRRDRRHRRLPRTRRRARATPASTCSSSTSRTAIPSSWSGRCASSASASATSN